DEVVLAGAPQEQGGAGAVTPRWLGAGVDLTQFAVGPTSQRGEWCGGAAADAPAGLAVLGSGPQRVPSDCLAKPQGLIRTRPEAMEASNLGRRQVDSRSEGDDPGGRCGPSRANGAPGSGARLLAAGLARGRPGFRARSPVAGGDAAGAGGPGHLRLLPAGE